MLVQHNEVRYSLMNALGLALAPLSPLHWQVIKLIFRLQCTKCIFICSGAGNLLRRHIQLALLGSRVSLRRK